VERLAAEAGVPLPTPDPRDAERDRRRQGLGDWLETAAQWFEAELRRPVGQAARAYLERRGLPQAEWSRFRLGFAPPGRTTLKDYLVAKGAHPGELVEAGLLIAPEEGGAPYDRFRERIIFPIADGRGRVVSFGGRAMDPQARAKYLNGPETPVFHKSHNLYGLAEARRILASAPSGEEAALAVVEGYMDVIACQRAGIAAVAAMGTALTEEQMALLWRHHPEPTLCFDGDRAGRQAASRAIDRALPLLQPGKSFRFAIVEGGKDPDEVLREQGAVALRQQLSHTTPFVDALFTRERDLEPLDTPERRAGLRARLMRAAASIADKDLAQAYRDDLRGRLDHAFAPPPRSRPPSPFRGRGRGGGLEWIPPAPTPEGRAAAKRLGEGPEPLRAALLRYAVADPSVLDAHLEDAFVAEGFGEPGLAGLTREVLRLRLEAEHLDSALLARHLAACGFSTLLTNIDRAAAASGAPFLKDDVSLEAARSQWSHAFAALTRLAVLEDSVAVAKQDLGAVSTDAAGFMRLKGERDALKRSIRTGTFWTEPES